MPERKPQDPESTTEPGEVKIEALRMMADLRQDGVLAGAEDERDYWPEPAAGVCEEDDGA